MCCAGSSFSRAAPLFCTEDVTRHGRLWPAAFLSKDLVALFLRRKEERNKGGGLAACVIFLSLSFALLSSKSVQLEGEKDFWKFHTTTRTKNEVRNKRAKQKIK